MNLRLRKLFGMIVMISFVVIYALVAMALAQSRPVLEAHDFVKGLFYVVAGLAWVLPVMPLIRWMEGR